jgi:aspartyl-tRNA(Asn)/glutamyl-tRNA(Gln) amidotransferase subunit C
MEPATSKSSAPELIDVAYVAHLARIALSDEERATYQRQLEQILDHVRQLDALDVSAIEPMAHAIPVKNRFREDLEVAGIEHQDVMNNAPESRQGQFFVPRILE